MTKVLALTKTLMKICLILSISSFKLEILNQILTCSELFGLLFLKNYLKIYSNI